jgi:hypothetical protein
MIHLSIRIIRAFVLVPLFLRYLWLAVLFFAWDVVIAGEDLGLLIILSSRLLLCRLPELLEDALVLLEEGVI